MNLIYFTSGQVLNDEEVRRQTLRIPEVLSSVQSEQSRFGFDLVATISMDEEFVKLPAESRAELMQFIQQGLFMRFCRFHMPYVDILYRNRYPTTAAIVNEMRWLFRTGDIEKVYVIGPGFDEVCAQVRGKGPVFIDSIDFDQQLSWFWSAVKKTANA